MKEDVIPFDFCAFGHDRRPKPEEAMKNSVISSAFGLVTAAR